MSTDRWIVPGSDQRWSMPHELPHELAELLHMTNLADPNILTHIIRIKYQTLCHYIYIYICEHI